MDMSRTHTGKGLWPSSLLVALQMILLVTGCAGIEPYEPRDYREEGPERGLFSGSDGEFVIYEKVDEPAADSKAGKESNKTTHGE